MRHFTQDDAHIFCTPEQVEDEVRGVCASCSASTRPSASSDVKIELSTRPDERIGSDEMWERAEGTLSRVLDAERPPAASLAYVLNPGDGAFYGPKIEYHLKDSIGRAWQCGTIQVDLSMPERFDITYTGPTTKSTGRS